MKIAVIFAHGTEEIEGITPVDVLKRAGVDCKIVTVGNQTIVGSHGIKIQGDMTTDELDIQGFDGIVIPGGLPGAKNIANDKINKVEINFFIVSLYPFIHLLLYASLRPFMLLPFSPKEIAPSSPLPKPRQSNRASQCQAHKPRFPNCLRSVAYSLSAPQALPA